MPLIGADQATDNMNAAETPTSLPDSLAPAPQEEKAPGFWDLTKNVFLSGDTAATFGPDNLGRVATQVSNDFMGIDTQTEDYQGPVFDNKRTDPNFDWWSQIKDTELEPHWKEFQYADNQGEFNFTADRLRQDLKTSQMLNSASGLKGFTAQLAAGLIDPINLIPFGTAAKAATVGGVIAKNAIKNAAILGTASTIANIGSEQPFSFESVAASSLIGALLGGTMGGVFAKHNIADSTAKKVVENILDGKPFETLDMNAGFHSVGAAETPPMVDTRLAGLGKFASKDTSAVTIGDVLDPPMFGYFRQPTVAALTSNNPGIRQLGERLFYVDNLLEKNKEGHATAVSFEALQDGQGKTDMYMVGDKFDEAYLSTNKSKGAVGATINARLFGGMTNSQLREEAARAMRSGDTSSIPQIDAYAKQMRPVVENYGNRAVEAGFFDDKLVFANQRSYLPRVYNTRAIIKDRGGFVKDMTKQILDGPDAEAKAKIDESIKTGEARLKVLEAEHADHTAKLEAGEAGSKVRLEELSKEIGIIKDQLIELRDTSEMTVDKATAIANELADNILRISGKDISLSHYDMLSDARGTSVIKKRGLAFIDDNNISKWLINDAPALIQMHISQISKMLNFKEAVLDPFGAKNAQDLIARVSEHDRKVVEDLEARGANTDKAIKRQQYNLKLTDDLIRVALGQYMQKTPYDSLAHFLKFLNYVSKMGHLIFNSMNDLAGPILHNGLPAVIKDSYIPTLVNIFRPAVRAMKIQDQRDANIAIQSAMDDNLRMMFESPAQSEVHFRTGWQRGQLGVEHVFNKASGVDWWVSSTRRMADLADDARIVRNLKKALAGDKKAAEDLLRSGIPEEDWADMSAAIDKYGRDLGLGTHVSNVSHWGRNAREEHLKQVYVAARNTANKTSNITPSRGSVPFWAQSNKVASLLYQFRGYFGASTIKQLLTVAQKRDARAAQFVVANIGLGMLQYIIASEMRGKDYDMRPATVIMEGFNRSGILGHLGDDIFGIIGSFRDQPFGRYFNRSPIDPLVGPTGSTITTPYNTFKKLAAGKELTRADQRKLVHLLPFMNLWYLDALLDRVYWNKK